MDRVSELREQSVGHVLNVGAHELGVHANERNGQCIGQEALLDLYSLGNNLENGLGSSALLEMREEQAGKVGVHALITRDELVGESETGHETTLLEPEDGSERTGEEDTFDGGESDETFGKSGATVRDPTKSPVGFLLDDGDGLDGVEEELALLGFADVGVDEEGVGFGVDVLHHDLETVEAASFGGLDFRGESLDEILVNDTVGSGEEGKDVRDEVTLVVVELVVPIVKILGKVDLFGGPEGGFGLLVHLPDL